MSGVASLSVVVAILLFCWVTYSVLGAFSTSSATTTAPTTTTTTAAAAAAAAATGAQPVRRISRVRGATTQAAFHISPPVLVDGKVDVYLDLASPDSAAAWKTTWEVVWEHGFRTEFEFHILPILQNKIVFDAAKAVQVLRMHSTDSGEYALFIDAMLGHQSLILSEADDEVARLQFFEEILVKEAVARGKTTEIQFKGWMKDPQVEQAVRSELESAAALGVRATPTIVLNGFHTMRLVGADQLRNFKLFIDSGMVPLPLYYPAGGVESVWASIERGGAGGEGADHDKNDIRSSGLGRSGELLQDNTAASVTM